MTPKQQTPAEERADWAAWLDRFEREILGVFTARGYSRDAAAIIYFTGIEELVTEVVDEDDDEQDR
jgi:hypothetical protein